MSQRPANAPIHQTGDEVEAAVRALEQSGLPEGKVELAVIPVVRAIDIPKEVSEAGWSHDGIND
jgi:hypothetical protein